MANLSGRVCWCGLLPRLDVVRFNDSAKHCFVTVFIPKTGRRVSLYDSVHCVSGSPAGSGRVGVWTNGNATSIRARQNMNHSGVGAEGFIKLGDIKGEFQLTQRLGGSASPGGDDVFMPEPLNVSMYDHIQAPVENVSLYDHVKSPRYQAFALMGR